MSRVVDELVTAGLVAGEPNPDDARSAFAVLTAEGLAQYRRAAPVYLAAIEEGFAGVFSDDELRVLRSLLQRARDSDRGLEAQPAPRGSAAL